VDLGKFLNGTEEEKNEVAKEIDKAFCTVGFVYLRNHGVARELVEECFAWVCVIPFFLPSWFRYLPRGLNTRRGCDININANPNFMGAE
jgi:hypothetical protein